MPSEVQLRLLMKRLRRNLDVGYSTVRINSSLYREDTKGFIYIYIYLYYTYCPTVNDWGRIKATVNSTDSGAILRMNMGLCVGICISAPILLHASWACQKDRSSYGQQPPIMSENPVRMDLPSGHITKSMVPSIASTF